MLLKIKELHIESNELIFQCVFLNNNLKMFYPFQNMKILVSCRQLYVPNHLWIHLSVGVLTVLLSSTSTLPVILNTMNSWSYRTLKWLTFHYNVKCSFFGILLGLSTFYNWGNPKILIDSSTNFEWLLLQSMRTQLKFEKKQGGID